MLYFFLSDTTVVVTHGFTKQQTRVPPQEIERARQFRARFGRDPATHAFHGGGGS